MKQKLERNIFFLIIYHYIILRHTGNKKTIDFLYEQQRKKISQGRIFPRYTKFAKRKKNANTLPETSFDFTKYFTF